MLISHSDNNSSAVSKPATKLVFIPVAEIDLILLILVSVTVTASSEPRVFTQ